MNKPVAQYAITINKKKKFNEDQLHTVEPETLRLSDRFDEAIGLEEKIDPFLLEDALPLPVEDLWKTK